MSAVRRQALAEVEAQILRHRDEIRILESKRNALMPISQLPAEILGRIFQFVQSDAGDKASTKDPATKHPGSELEWIKISHVTRHWRELAINQTSLWTSPPMQHTRWALEMLKRSKAAPVRIMLDASLVEAKSKFLSTITSHMTHVATVNVWKASSTFLRRFFEGLPAKMPALEEISINVKHMGEGGQDNPLMFGPNDQQLLALPDSICGRAPALRSLQLVQINVNWKSPMLHSLTTLGLYFTTPPTLTLFRSALENMPNLEILTIQNALPTPSSKDRHPQKPITLSKLRKLTVGGGPDEVECFFTHFLAPSVKNVHSSFIYQEGSYDLPFILSTIKHPYARPSPGPRSMLFFFHRLFLTQIAFGESDNVQPGLNLKVIAMQNLTVPASTDETDPLMTQLFEGVDWSRLREISIARIFVSADVLADTFGSLPYLKKISVGAQSALPLIEALQKGADIDPALDPTSIVFPGLTEVFMKAVPIDVGFGFSQESEVYVDDLLDCLMSRCERGVPIHQLTLRRCRDVDEEIVEILGEIVVEVDWDHASSDIDEEEAVDHTVDDDDSD